MTRLYLRVVVPLTALVTAWSMYVASGGLNAAAVIFLGLLLLTGVAHGAVPARWEWPVRLLFSGSLIVFALVLALFRESLGVTVQALPQGINIVLLLAPVTVLVWSLLFYDHPRVGFALIFTLSLSVAFLVDRWGAASAASVGPGTAPLLLAVCLIAQIFGWAVMGLQRRVLLGERQVRLDPLTGLLNRRAFEEVSEAPAPHGVLAVVDVDHFKQVNDQHGHEVGDRVLRVVADVLRREVDGGGAVYRWGGEEFVVWLPGASIVAANTLLEGVRREVAGRVRVGGRSVTISIGLSESGADQPPVRAFPRADTALRAAKAAGRDQIKTAPVSALSA